LSLVCSLLLVSRSGVKDSWRPRLHWWQEHRTSDDVAMVRPKLELYKGRKYSEFYKKRISDANHMGNEHREIRDGRRLCPTDTNIAVKDSNQLASEPVVLQIDRNGKNILEGEEAKSAIPWSTHDAHGISAAEAPSSFEEFAARYQNIDTFSKGLFKLGQDELETVEKTILNEDGRDDYRMIRTFSWLDDDVSSPSTVMLIGVTELSGRSRQLAARAVYEAEPTALVLQLCREQVGRQLVMPAEHRFAVANYQRGFASTNPHRARPMWHNIRAINADYDAMQWMSGLAYYAAWHEFLQLPEHDILPKVLCLGDVLSSKLKEVQFQKGKQALTAVPTLSARGKQIARGLIASASAGHKVVLGIVDASLLGTVTTWLERAGARLMAVADASDIDAGRESIAADVQLGLNADLTNRQVQASRASEVLGFGQRRLGAFLNERGMQLLDLRRQRLSKTTRLKDLVHHREPPKKWQVAELLGGDGPTPGPGALLAPQPGLLFEKGFLEVPKHYLRDAGMERFSESLWELLCRRGGALETEDAMELEWWLAGAAESEGDSGPSETSFLDSAWLEQ